MSVSRHQAFEFFKPVEDDVDLGRGPLTFVTGFLNHQKPLAIGRNIVVTAPAKVVASREQDLGTSRRKNRLSLDANRHHRLPVGAAVEQLPPIRSPDGRVSPPRVKSATCHPPRWGKA